MYGRYNDQLQAQIEAQLDSDQIGMGRQAQLSIYYPEVIKAKCKDFQVSSALRTKTLIEPFTKLSSGRKDKCNPTSSYIHLLEFRNQDVHIFLENSSSDLTGLLPGEEGGGLKPDDCSSAFDESMMTTVSSYGQFPKLVVRLQTFKRIVSRASRQHVRFG